MNSTIDLLSLHCFLEAARQLNFRAAAANLHLSPAAFGQRIAAVERDFEAVLFERTTRRVSLTPSGELALPQIRNLLAGIQQVKSDIISPRLAPFELTLGTRFELGLSWLTPSLTKLRKLRPERTIHLSFGDSDDMVQRVQRFQIDASVNSSRQLPPGAQYSTLHEEKYEFVGRRAVLNKHPISSFKDTSHHTLIDINAELPLFRYFLDGQGDGEPWSFKHLEQMGTIAAIRHRVLEGCGIAVLPEYFVREDLRKRRLVRVLPKAKLMTDAFRLVWMSDNPHGRELLQLSEDLRDIPLA